MANKASSVRKGTFTLKTAADTAAVVFSCDPTAIRMVPTAGDTGDTLEVLCGDVIAGEPGPTTWTMEITSIQQVESASTDADSLVLYALKHDGETAAFTFKPSPTTQTFYGSVRIIPIAIGGEVGGTKPTSDVVWTMAGKPTTTPPTLLATEASAAKAA